MSKTQFGAASGLSDAVVVANDAALVLSRQVTEAQRKIAVEIRTAAVEKSATNRSRQNPGEAVRTDPAEAKEADREAPGLDRDVTTNEPRRLNIVV
jgi:hypothetical protein